jgi:NDP-sugar pyrophosphorylase family protein
VFLVGKHDPKKFSHFIDECLTEFSFKTIQFISDDVPKNEAGVLLKYRTRLLEDDPSYLLVLRYKICSSFPLTELIHFHKQKENLMGCGLDDKREEGNNRALLTVMTTRLDSVQGGPKYFVGDDSGEEKSSRTFGMFAIEEAT